MEDEVRDRIVDDLLRKEPLKQYTDQVLFDMGFKTSVSVEHYICQRFYNVVTSYSLGRRKATVTRRTRRIWPRIEKAVERVTKSGGRGVYSVRELWKWGEPALGFLFADSSTEARKLAEMFFGFLVEDISKLEVKFIESGDATAIEPYNEELMEKYRKSLKDHRETVVDSTEKVKRYSSMLEYLENFKAATFGDGSLNNKEK